MNSRCTQALPDLSSLSSLTDLSAGQNRLAGAGALGALPACLTKLVLRENTLGEVPLAVLNGLPALQARELLVLLKATCYPAFMLVMACSVVRFSWDQFDLLLNNKWRLRSIAASQSMQCFFCNRWSF